MTKAARTGPNNDGALDARFIESLLGYNVRRASLTIIGHFMDRMAPHKLGPVDFSILSLIKNNPGITSRQLCTALGILPPNLVGLIHALEKRALLERRAHPHDGRALGLHLSGAGLELMRNAERTAVALEEEAASRLTERERKTLMRLLQKIYLP